MLSDDPQIVLNGSCPSNMGASIGESLHTEQREKINREHYTDLIGKNKERVMQAVICMAVQHGILLGLLHEAFMVFDQMRGTQQFKAAHSSTRYPQGVFLAKLSGGLT
jgi:hypothetical protein